MELGSDVTFELSEEFIAKYKGKQPKWGPLGYVVYKRSYSRTLPNGKSEEYWQTVKRVVEGAYTIQRRHCTYNKLPWSQKKAQNSAQEMYRLIWEFKFTPPGRGFWMLGTDYIFDRGTSAPLQNCSFITTENITTDFAEPFCFMADMLMLGVGGATDTKGAGKLTIREPRVNGTYTVDDSREGWVDLLRTVLEAYAGKNELPDEVDYSQIRAKGTPLKGFGGISSGCEPLQTMVEDVRRVLNCRIGQKITSTDIVDIADFIGKCVVSGNIRRSALLILGDPDDDEYLDLKDPNKSKDELIYHRWASNLSVFAEVGMDYTKIVDRIIKNGEPGLFWIQNARDYSRMGHPPDFEDRNVMGTNACGEITLEGGGDLCNLVETYPTNHDSLDEWIHTLKYAYLYAKTVTLLPTHNHKTNAIMMKNRRIGCSITGIAQAFAKFGRRNAFKAMDQGYDRLKKWDRTYSDWLCVPRSIKICTVKPSGSVSLLCQATPGIHYPIAEYYIRNIRFQDNSPLLKQLEEAGYSTEKDVYSDNTTVVSFPVHEEHFERSVDDVGLWEQMENVAAIQEHWSDNSISCTIHFKPEEAGDIVRALELYETRLKSISFLPIRDHGYEQAPYIPITKEEYEIMKENIENNIKIKKASHEITDKFCNSDACQMPSTPA